MSRFKATLILIFIAMSTTCTMTATSPSTATSCTWGFECANKRCIHLLLRCDGTDDCGDFSDETNCTCQTGNFACASGKCINKNWVCDGENDCGDNSDEVNCTAKAVDPCANDGGCYHICKVIKAVNGTPTGRKCDCRLGYYLRGDGTTCEDVDECMTPNICAGKCHNTEGSYYCDCKAGFKMGSDMKSCIDVNECDVNNGGCEHLCHNNIGSYTCSCKTGYVQSYRNPKHCEDFDECSLGVPKCHECHNIPGGYACKCDKGFIQNANKTSCMDVDECAKGNAGCEHICQNLLGSYECRCKHGFKAPAKGSKSCEDIDECAANRGRGPCEYGCRNIRGSYQCSCENGRMLAGDKWSCIDINECQQSKNLCDQKCVNDDPGYHCDCKKGFYLASDGKTCRDTVDYSECGQTSDKFQATGAWKITNRSSWPWIVHFSFHFGGWFAMATQGCLGTILNDRWVITSRHCAEDMDSESSVVEFNNGNQIEVDDVIPYCSWNSKKPCTSNVALIKLRKAISFSANVRPICLPKPSRLSAALRDRSKTLAMILRKQGTTYYKKTVRIRKGKDCTQKWFHSRTMICAGNKKVSCPGDSGTPLMFSLLKNSKKYSVYLGGILGFNSNLADCEQKKSRYLGYVHIQKLRQWIREKTSF